jgi:hydroxymethylpyrimidine/phosphomethylpyrimidine kinase
VLVFLLSCYSLGTFLLFKRVIMSKTYPVVLSFSGHDPSGGAGIQADIETLSSHHCHNISVITALTEQDSHNVKKLIPQAAENIISQANTLFADMPVAVIKIGLLGHYETAQAIAQILQQHPDIPVVFDPILAAGGGAQLSDMQLIESINTLLLPYTTILTPNAQEARALTGLEDLTACGLALLEKGCDYVLITGTEEQTSVVENQLFQRQQASETFRWERLPHTYHGSGCTLASSIAGLLAQGLEPFSAIAEAQDYTWNALEAGYKVGKGQYKPHRFFWVEVE